MSDIKYHLLPGEHKVTTNMVVQHVNKFVLQGSSMALSVLKCTSQVYISVKFCSNFTIADVSIRNCGSTYNFLASVVIYNCAFCNITNVHFRPRMEYSIVGTNLIGNCHLNGIIIDLIPSSLGVCGLGISLKYTDNVDSMMNSITIINNFTSSDKHLQCLSYGNSKQLPGVLLSLATNQMQYTVIIQLTKVFIYNVFFYGRPVIYVALMKCKTNYVLFENSTFTGIQHNRLKSFDEYGIMPSIIFVHVSCKITMVKFSSCVFYSNLLSSSVALIDIDSFPTKKALAGLHNSKIVIDTCVFSQNLGTILRAYT